MILLIIPSCVTYVPYSNLKLVCDLVLLSFLGVELYHPAPYILAINLLNRRRCLCPKKLPTIFFLHLKKEPVKIHVLIMNSNLLKLVSALAILSFLDSI
jgi:hypothetical protein